MTISLKEGSSEGDVIKDFLYHYGRDQIREKLGIYISSLREGR